MGCLSLLGSVDERNSNRSAAKPIAVAGAPYEGSAYEPGPNFHPLPLRGLIILCCSFTAQHQVLKNAAGLHKGWEHREKVKLSITIAGINKSP